MLDTEWGLSDMSGYELPNNKKDMDEAVDAKYWISFSQLMVGILNFAANDFIAGKIIELSG